MGCALTLRSGLSSLFFGLFVGISGRFFGLAAGWPGQIREAAEELAPHAMAFFLRDLASAFHGWYNAERFLVDDAGLREARLVLLGCVGQVLRQGLSLVGVSAPESM
ncbi:MAG: hypothetical protein EBW39_11660 [Betaproteobacteria bacterium]|nr:hypothetical protein [Betaproteobacteria bacterium]